MPFTRVGPNEYRSPSGRRYTARQVRAYYATGGFKRKPRKPGSRSRGNPLHAVMMELSKIVRRRKSMM